MSSIYIFNTLIIGDRTYSFADHKSLHHPSEFDLPKGFYGGRIFWVGRTDTDVLLLIEQVKGRQYNVFDTAAESLAHIPIEILRKMCDSRSIPYLTHDEGDKKATTHKELQKFLK